VKVDGQEAEGEGEGERQKEVCNSRDEQCDS